MQNNTFARGIIIAILVVAVVWGGFTTWLHSLHKPGPLTNHVTIVFNPGVSTSEIAEVLETQGVIGSAFVFKLASRASLSDRIYKAGEYTFGLGVSM